jgi:hypothetical protein
MKNEPYDFETIDSGNESNSGNESKIHVPITKQNKTIINKLKWT